MEKESLEHMNVCFGDVVVGDIIVDPNWPKMFGRRVVGITRRRRQTYVQILLRLDRHAALCAGEHQRTEVLR